MKEIPKLTTKWTIEEILRAYYAAWPVLGLGTDPTAECLAIVAAQSTIECGRGGVYCYNWNVSNIMGVSPEGTYHLLRNAPECGDPNKLPAGATVLTSTNVKCAPGKVAYLPAGGSKFRAYSTLQAGCEDKFLTLQRIWPRAIEALLEQDAGLATVVHTYVLALCKPRYFSADEVSYQASVGSIAKEYLEAARAVIKDEEPLYGPEIVPPATIDTSVPAAVDFVRGLAVDGEDVDGGNNA